MAQEIKNQEAVASEGWLGSCLLWLFWGGSMSFMAVLSLVLVASLTLNVYLGWELAGLEMSISRPAAEPAEVSLPLPAEIMAAIPTMTPAVSSDPSSAAPLTGEPDVGRPASPLEVQVATLAALATETADKAVAGPPAVVLFPTATAMPVGAPPEETEAETSPPDAPPAVAIGTPAVEAGRSEPAAQQSAAAEAGAASLGETPPAALAQAQAFEPATSSNSYELIPINGEREKRPAAEHGDLNLKLREPQPVEAELALVDAGSGVDADAPKLGDIFEPNFTAAYAVHDWDWGCNCPGDLIQDDEAMVIGIETTPGEPIFIPPTERDIYDGKFHAVLLYASEDSLTFVYTREGTVAMGYTVHYIGLRTDPNLLALYRQSEGNELPGLTLDTPVGTATDELIVAIRDNGKFLDARSINDWWD